MNKLDQMTNIWRCLIIIIYHYFIVLAVTQINDVKVGERIILAHH